MTDVFTAEREALEAQYEQLRKDIEFSRMRTGVLLLVVTFFLLSAIQSLFEWQFRAPAFRYAIFYAVAPNVSAWLLWATSYYLSLVRRGGRYSADIPDPHRFWYDRLQSATFLLQRQRRLEAYISILAALQIIALILALVSPILLR